MRKSSSKPFGWALPGLDERTCPHGDAAFLAFDGLGPLAHAVHHAVVVGHMHEERGGAASELGDELPPLRLLRRLAVAPLEGIVPAPRTSLPQNVLPTTPSLSDMRRTAEDVAIPEKAVWVLGSRSVDQCAP